MVGILATKKVPDMQKFRS